MFEFNFYFSNTFKKHFNDDIYIKQPFLKGVIGVNDI